MGLIFTVRADDDTPSLKADESTLGTKARSPADRSTDEAIAAIKKLRGKIEFDGNKEVVSVDLSGSMWRRQEEPTKGELTKIDACLVHLPRLTKLTKLDLSYRRVTDAGLEHLKGLTNLLRLDLIGTKVTDEGLKKLQTALPNCWSRR
ncbi:MAG: hypothetical protein IH899_03455 [Planctomycetes bacterium]|nr:hypothetical protein [Planctomycetota bacterium]